MKVGGIRDIHPVMPLNQVTRSDVGEPEKEQVKKYEDESMLPVDKDKSMSVEKAVDLLNKTMESYNTQLKFTLHEGSGEYMVKVINTKDDTVIREIPPESILDMVAYFKELLGIVVDKFI